MPRIELENWEPVPDKPGCVRSVGTRTAREVFKDMESFLWEENLYPDDYFSLDWDFRKKEDEPLPHVDNVICYAAWGGSEGVYFEVEFVVRHPTDHRRMLVGFATGKTLGETAKDYDRMQYIAGRLYRALMGDGVDL